MTNFAIIAPRTVPDIRAKIVGNNVAKADKAIRNPRSNSQGALAAAVRTITCKVATSSGDTQACMASPRAAPRFTSRLPLAYAPIQSLASRTTAGAFSSKAQSGTHNEAQLHSTAVPDISVPRGSAHSQHLVALSDDNLANNSSLRSPAANACCALTNSKHSSLLQYAQGSASQTCCASARLEEMFCAKAGSRPAEANTFINRASSAAGHGSEGLVCKRPLCRMISAASAPHWDGGSSHKVALSSMPKAAGSTEELSNSAAMRSDNPRTLAAPMFSNNGRTGQSGSL
mmetsp:Transcript_111954/g.321675  ORF Transcript_111954/g.321675 Transcript_111954/m.321675 type:complete len:287 (-) Transcript_111954:787-1647(-)